MYRQIHNLQPLGSTRLSDEDVRAVIDLWLERQWGDQRASVADVAEGLDITVEEVQALIQEVYKRRARVEIDIVDERERLELEQRELAAEQARLVQTERRLASLRVERTNLGQERLEARGRYRDLGGRQSRKPSMPTRRSALDSITAVVALLLVGGFGMMALWDGCTAVVHALLR